jgi:hypothetical protein
MVRNEALRPQACATRSTATLRSGQAMYDLITTNLIRSCPRLRSMTVLWVRAAARRWPRADGRLLPRLLCGVKHANLVRIPNAYTSSCGTSRAFQRELKSFLSGAERRFASGSPSAPRGTRPRDDSGRHDLQSCRVARRSSSTPPRSRWPPSAHWLEYRYLARVFSPTLRRAPRHWFHRLGVWAGIS